MNATKSRITAAIPKPTFAIVHAIHLSFTPVGIKPRNVLNGPSLEQGSSITC
jgi:hypothetical protein